VKKAPNHQFPAQTVAGSLVVAAVGVTTIQYDWTVGLLMIAVSAGIIAVSVRHWRRQRTSTTAAVSRMHAQASAHHGVATARDHRRHTSAAAVRRKAPIVLPSLSGTTRRQLRKVPTGRYAFVIGRDGRHAVHHLIEHVLLLLGPPRSGKTGLIAGIITDASGPVIATSTKEDIVLLTAASRQNTGRILIFNPSGVGDWASTVRWSILDGCMDPAVAKARAADMIPPSPSPEGERWDLQGRNVLAVLLHAAALRDDRPSKILNWISPAGTRESQNEVAAALQESTSAGTMIPTWIQFGTLNDRTQTSITSAIMPALQWMLDPRAAALADVPAGGGFDVGAFLDSRDTLYMLGKRDGAVAPLVGAFTGAVARAAYAKADKMPRQRLEPPLTLALDEAALICPVPLDEWTADMGGRNITIVIAVQGRSQLRKHWGDNGASTIMNNSGLVGIFGGGADPDDLGAYSLLSGDRLEVVETKDNAGHTSVTTRPVPVLTAAQVRALPEGRMMMVRGGMPVAILALKMAWQRKDLQRAMSNTPWAPTIETPRRHAKTPTTGDQ